MQFLPLVRLALALLACPAVAAAADPVATVTLLEGSAGLIRGVTRYALAEGVRLQHGDIVEIGDKGLAEIEFGGGTALGLGAGTRILAVALAGGGSVGGDFYALHGLLKLSGVKAGTHFRLATPILTLQPGQGTAVVVVGGGEGSVFIESGDARLSNPSPPVRLKGGDFYTRKGAQKGAVAPRPSQAFIAALPKLFLDPLPSRLARFKERQVEPRQIAEASYAEVEAWLKAPPEVRRPMVSRFKARASDPAFRSALVSNLKFHPEWDPVLYPEKYESKGSATKPASASQGAPVPARPAGKP